ncbi:MAG: hypothetical protein ACFFF4_15905 [Candidatus Thorarchaeota archaeon]
MQGTDLGIAFIYQAIATISAVASVFIGTYVKTRVIRRTSKRYRIFQWIFFVVVVTIFQIYSGILMLSSGHYLEISAIVVSYALLGISGWLSLS